MSCVVPDLRSFGCRCSSYTQQAVFRPGDAACKILSGGTRKRLRPPFHAPKPGGSRCDDCGGTFKTTINYIPTSRLQNDAEESGTDFGYSVAYEQRVAAADSDWYRFSSAPNKKRIIVDAVGVVRARQALETVIAKDLKDRTVVKAAEMHVVVKMQRQSHRMYSSLKNRAIRNCKARHVRQPYSFQAESIAPIDYGHPGNSPDVKHTLEFVQAATPSPSSNAARFSRSNSSLANSAVGNTAAVSPTRDFFNPETSPSPEIEMAEAPQHQPVKINSNVEQPAKPIGEAGYSDSSKACQPQRAAHITPSQNLIHSRHAQVKSVALVLDASSIKDISMDDAPSAKPTAIKPGVAQNSTPVIGIGAGYSASPMACQPIRPSALMTPQTPTTSAAGSGGPINLQSEPRSILRGHLTSNTDPPRLRKSISFEAKTKEPAQGNSGRRPRRQASNSRSSKDSQLKKAIQIRNLSLSSAPQIETAASQRVKPGQQKQTIQMPDLGFLPPSRAPEGHSSKFRASQPKQAMPSSGGQPFSMPVVGAGYSRRTKACQPRRP